VYFKAVKRTYAEKGALADGKIPQEFAQIKRGRGESIIRPAWTPVSL